MPFDTAKIRRMIKTSHAEFCRAAGMDRHAFSRLLAGRRLNPRIATLETLASALGCAISEILKK